MANPYYICAYGHVMRISKRVEPNTRAEDNASLDTFGIGMGGSQRFNVTVIRCDGKGWSYLTNAKKAELTKQLAIKHKRLTGETLSGYEKMVANVKGPEGKPRTAPKSTIGELKAEPCQVDGVDLWGITDGVHWFFYAYDTKEEAEALAVDVDSEAKYRANICNEQAYRRGNYFQ